LTACRNTKLREMVQGLSTDFNYGLIAYGHRRKSDCSDIELLLPIGPLDPDAFSAAVNGLMPRGRTPLTDAVHTAAEVMNYQDRSARIILVSDGLESCNADPFALAGELEAAGLDFTTHAIGFDVASIADQSQLSCLADNTGGLYLTADSTEELTLALQAVAAPVAAPAFALVAVDQSGNPINNASIMWSIENLSDESYMLSGETGASVTVGYQADNYRAYAPLGKREGDLVFFFDGKGNAVFEVILPPDVSLDAPGEVDAGSSFDLIWQGPGRAAT